LKEMMSLTQPSSLQAPTQQRKRSAEGEEKIKAPVLHRMKEKLNRVLQPAKMISDSSAEGITWLVGYEGISAAAVMKYAMSSTKYDRHQNMLHELLVGLVLNGLVSVTPNFMYMYGAFVCNAPEPQQKQQQSTSSSYDFGELCSVNLSSKLKAVALFEVVANSMSFSDFVMKVRIKAPINGVVYEWKDVYQAWFQVLCSLSIAHRFCKFVHGDLHGNNVLIKFLPVSRDLEYALMPDKVLKLSGNRVLAKIIDFGRSKVLLTDQVMGPLRFNSSGDQPFSAKRPCLNENAIMTQYPTFPVFFDVVRFTTSFLGVVKKTPEGWWQDELLLHVKNTDEPVEQITFLEMLYRKDDWCDVDVNGNPEVFGVKGATTWEPFAIKWTETYSTLYTKKGNAITSIPDLLQYMSGLLAQRQMKL